MKGTISCENGKMGHYHRYYILWIAAVLIIAIVLIGIGVMYIFNSSIGPPEKETSRDLNLQGEIIANEDRLELTVLSGTIIWKEYSIKVDDVPLTEGDHKQISRAGDTIYFFDDPWGPVAGNSYNVKIVEIATNDIVWKKDIRARS